MRPGLQAWDKRGAGNDLTQPAEQALLSSLVDALVTDKFEQQEVGTAPVHRDGGLSGANLFTLTIGQSVGTTGYEPIFVCLSIFDITALVVVWFTLADRRAGPTALLPVGPAVLKA